MADFPHLPLFTDAYLADTRHLTTEEHGAYLLLLMEAWRRPECCLPDDDVLLSRLSGLSVQRWAEVKPVVMSFWKRDGRRKVWTQKRLSKERGYVAEKSQSQRDKAVKRWSKTRKKDAAALPTECPADAPTPTPTPTPSLTTFEKRDGGGDARDNAISAPDGPTLRERILKACGADPTSGLTGPNGTVLGTRADMQVVQAWQADLGLADDQIVAVIDDAMSRKRDGPPSRLSYFDKPMQREAGSRTRPTLTPIEGGPHDQSPRTSRQAAASDTLRYQLDVAGRMRRPSKGDCF